MYIPNPIRCRKCFKFGHFSDNCTKDAICGFCATPEHIGSPCQTIIPKCVNCNDTHHSLDIKCPKFVDEKGIKLIQFREKVAYNVARKLYFQTQGTSNLISYAAVLKKKNTGVDIGCQTDISYSPAKKDHSQNSSLSHVLEDTNTLPTPSLPVPPLSSTPSLVTPTITPTPTLPIPKPHSPISLPATTPPPLPSPNPSPHPTTTTPPSIPTTSPPTPSIPNRSPSSPTPPDPPDPLLPSTLQAFESPRKKRSKRRNKKTEEILKTHVTSQHEDS